MKFIAIVGCLCVMFVGVSSAQTYVGSDLCGACHGLLGGSTYDVHAAWVESGHHYKLNEVTGPQAPVYPFEFYPGTPNVVDLPSVSGSPLAWTDVSYVIGGYYWKARFMDLNGWIYTGEATDLTQWNIWNQEWVAYHAGEVNKPYDCGRCHTTGYDDQGVNPLPGIVGTWEEDGIGCEACHGPGSDHAAAPSTQNITIDPTAAQCGTCHYRDSQNRIPYSNGFIRHHEQYEELVRSPHDGLMECVECHDPHKSTVYDQGGLLDGFECTSCHSQGNYLVQGMETLECWDCHMAYAGKSGQTLNAYTGDVRSHIMNVITDPVPRDSVVYEDGGNWYMELDASGWAQLTLDWVCLSCHTDTMTLESAAAWAQDIHVNHPSAVRNIVTETLPESFVFQGAFPNPFNPTTTLRFDVAKRTDVKLTVYNLNGQLVSELVNEVMEPGTHQVPFDGTSLSAGIYIANLEVDNQALQQKVALIK